MDFGALKTSCILDPLQGIKSKEAQFKTLDKNRSGLVAEKRELRLYRRYRKQEPRLIYQGARSEGVIVECL